MERGAGGEGGVTHLDGTDAAGPAARATTDMRISSSAALCVAHRP